MERHQEYNKQGAYNRRIATPAAHHPSVPPNGRRAAGASGRRGTRRRGVSGAADSWNRLASRAATLPLFRQVAYWYDRRPFLTSWLLLAAGMVTLMTLFSLDAGLAPREYAAIAAATVGLAWLCVWIVFLEEQEPGNLDGLDGEPPDA